MTINNRIKALARKYQDALDVPYMKALPLAQMANEVIPDRVVYAGNADSGPFVYDEPLIAYLILEAMGGDWVLRHDDMEAPYRWFWSNKLGLEAQFATFDESTGKRAGFRDLSMTSLDGFNAIILLDENGEETDWNTIGLEPNPSDARSAYVKFDGTSILAIIEQVRIAFMRINL